MLLDECVPKALKRAIQSSQHVCSTVQEAGWAGKKNGEFLELAEPEFDVFVTADTHLRHQQNLMGRRIALIVLVGRSNRLKDLRPLFPSCIAALEKIRSGEVIHVDRPQQSECRVLPSRPSSRRMEMESAI